MPLRAVRGGYGENYTLKKLKAQRAFSEPLAYSIVFIAIPKYH